MVRIINQRSKEGNLPEEFAKYVNIDSYKFPCIRSLAEADEGWCIVEADYQTAEMRGLAFISGDRDLTAMLLDPDTMFAKVKPEYVPEGVDPSECTCRISYPKYITNCPEKDNYLMTHTAKGKVIAKFTEDMLQKDDKGNILSPKFDMH